MKLEDYIIKEIAEQLDCGMTCFLNKKTGVPKFVVDVNNPNADAVLEFYQQELEEIDKNWSDYSKIEKMPSNHSFQIMIDFAETVGNKKIQEKLFHTLNQRKPFRNFRNVVDCYEDLRQNWFEFKNKKYLEWVKNELEYII